MYFHALQQIPSLGRKKAFHYVNVKGTVRCPFAVLLFSCVRQQRHLTGPFDGTSQLALVLGRRSSYPPWQNFAPFADKLLQQFDIFIVDVVNVVHGKVTHFTALVSASTSHVTPPLHKVFH